MKSPPAQLRDVFSLAQSCIEATSVTHKISCSQTAAALVAENRVSFDAAAAPVPIRQPGRPENPRLVDARAVPRRRLGSDAGRAALIHAVAHIEFNAIDLAWDAVYRFHHMPVAYYRNWASVAADETRHFSMLQARLKELGHAYGDFDAHNGLWEMAVKTADSCLARMALVPRVLEARGLDATPPMIERLRSVGDDRTADILEIILCDEVGHVAIGSHWFAWCCARAGALSEPTFAALIGQHAVGALRPPLNYSARVAAGFSLAELMRLTG